MNVHEYLNQTLNKQLSDGELKNFLSRATVQLDQELTRDLLSIVTELINLRATIKSYHLGGLI